jgi:hypothetical protein
VSKFTESTEITTTIIRSGGGEPQDGMWMNYSPEERIEAVWTLTKLCLTWNNQLSDDEPRLERTLRTLNDEGVEYLIVGAHALAVYGHVRATKDLDVWVRANGENAIKLIAALRSFGAPLLDLTSEDLSTPGTVFQIGLPPLRVDLLTQIDGIEFSVAWPDRVQANFGDVSVFVISRKHLILNKQASGRLQDLADVEQLQTVDPENQV